MRVCDTDTIKRPIYAIHKPTCRLLGAVGDDKLRSYYQYIKYANIVESNGLWYLENFGTGGSAVDLEVGNVPILTIEGGVYMTFVDLNGATIVSNEGTSSPTKINDQRIDFTAGTVWDILLSNGTLLHCQDAQGVKIANSVNGNHGTLIGATQIVAWGTRSDVAYPALNDNGGSKVIVNTVAGTASTLADPNNENVDVELVTTGGWTAGTGWTETSLVFDCDGTQGADSDILKDILTNAEYNSIEINMLAYSAGNLTLLTGSGTSQAASTTLGKTNYFGLTAGSTDLILRADLNLVASFKISCKKVTAIPSYGEGYFSFNKGGAANDLSIYIFSNIPNIPTGAEEIYSFRIDANEALRLTKPFEGTVFKTIDDYINNTTTYQIHWQRNSYINEFITGGVGMWIFYIKGGTFTDWTIINASVLGSNPILDNDHTETKFVLIDGDAADEVSQMSKDGVKYYRSFIDGTGTFEERYAIGVGSGLDSDGNDAEYPANSVWPNSYKYRQPSGDAGQFAVSLAYSLAWYRVDLNDNLWVDFNTLKEYDTSSIPEADFQIDNNNPQGVVRKIASQPYELATHNGEPVMHNGVRVTSVKLF